MLRIRCTYIIFGDELCEVTSVNVRCLMMLQTVRRKLNEFQHSTTRSSATPTRVPVPWQKTSSAQLTNPLTSEQPQYLQPLASTSRSTLNSATSPLRAVVVCSLLEAATHTSELVGNYLETSFQPRLRTQKSCELVTNQLETSSQLVRDPGFQLVFNQFACVGCGLYALVDFVQPTVASLSKTLTDVVREVLFYLFSGHYSMLSHFKQPSLLID